MLFIIYIQILKPSKIFIYIYMALLEVDTKLHLKIIKKF